ncbi:MAG: hypothetical protein GXY86_17615 [Firmicutes bacterium]|nr:hypothetical protein [Bacillota bacterium]
MKWLLIDVVLEFFNWLVDRKSYKKRTLDSLKHLGIGLIMLFLVGSIAFLVLVVIHIKMTI